MQRKSNGFTMIDVAGPMDFDNMDRIASTTQEDLWIYRNEGDVCPCEVR
jgi:hypothetical protein